MKITAEKPDGSLVAEVDFNDGMIQVGIRNAQVLATKLAKVVYFTWNGVPLAIVADSSMDLIMRSWEAREPGDLTLIGPYPDSETTPEYSHGILTVEV